MNNIQKMHTEQKDIAGFSQAYFSYLGDVLKSLDTERIVAFMEAVDAARRNDATVFVAGNGGSASTASHMGTDFGSASFKADSTEHPLRVMPLTDPISMITATANDYGYDDIFTKQLEVQYRDGDILIVISASGNSANLVKAAEWVRARGGKTLGLLGFDGGKLQDLCDVAIVARTPKGEYGPVEDVHMILNHMFTSWLHRSFGKPV